MYVHMPRGHELVRLAGRQEDHSSHGQGCIGTIVGDMFRQSPSHRVGQG